MISSFNNVLQVLKKTNLKKLVWIVALSETLHNIEEAIWMPGWSHSAGMWQQPVGTFEFRFAVTVLTLLFYGIIFYYYRSNNQSAKYLMSGLLVLILFNVFIPHLLAAIFLTRYAPGVITGVLFNIPVTLYFLRRGIKEKEFDKRTLIFGSLGFAIVTLPLLFLLFALGSFAERFN